MKIKLNGVRPLLLCCLMLTCTVTFAATHHSKNGYGYIDQGAYVTIPGNPSENIDQRSYVSTPAKPPGYVEEGSYVVPAHTPGYIDVIAAGSLSKVHTGNSRLRVTRKETDTLVQTNNNKWNSWGGAVWSRLRLFPF